MIREYTLRFYPLTFIADGEETIVGQVGGTRFAALPPDGVALLKQMQAGLTPQEASDWYEKEYHEAVDIDDFLQTLQDIQLIRFIDGRSLRQRLKREAPSWVKSVRVRLVPLEGAQQLTEELYLKPLNSVEKEDVWRLIGRAFFSPLAWFLYVAIFGYCVLLIAQHPYLFPNYQQVFFSPSYTVVEFGIFFAQFPAILFHEWFHMLAGRRLGIRSRLSIGRRLYFIVFETDLTGLWSVPPNARYLPYLAGMIADTLFFSLMIIIANITYVPGNIYGFPSSFCLAMAYSTVLRFLWQFYFYLRTDIYYVVITAFHCINLQQVTQQYIANRFYRLIKRSDKIQDESLWPQRDRRVVPWYAVVFLLGYAFSLGIFVLMGIPLMLSSFAGLVIQLLTSTSLSAGFWDTTTFLSLNILQLSLIGWLIVRDRKKRKGNYSLPTSPLNNSTNHSSS